MRFLVDECLSAQVAVALTAAGHDAMHVVTAGLKGRPDEDVMNRATVESRVLITADTDFGELLAQSGERFPSVILLRRSSRRPEQQTALVIVNLPEIEDDLETGSLIVMTDSSLRVRSLPI